MVLPLINHGHILALLYLENHQVSGVFIPNKIKSLELLATQVSISITNANFFAELESKVESRTADLNQALADVEYKNEQILDSLLYAQSMQMALLPKEPIFEKYLDEYFILWEPKELVGGDIYFAKPVEGGFVILLIDCTGHGVPGAFMTMIAGAAMEQLCQASDFTDPGSLLQWLNQYVTDTLQQGSHESLSDNGMDASICFIPDEKSHLYFAGAKMDLLIHDGESFTRIKGDKKSIGYRRSNTEYKFATHEISSLNHTFYLFSDGIIDQIGGAKGFPLGRKKVMAQLEATMHKTLSRQRKDFEKFFKSYQGDKERLDDLSMLGFRVRPFGLNTQKSEADFDIQKEDLRDEILEGFYLKGSDSVLDFGGLLDDKKLSEIVKHLQLKLEEHPYAIKTISIVIEQCQNMMRYSCMKAEGEAKNGLGWIRISKQGMGLSCLSVNPIQSEDVDRLSSLFNKYASCSQEELKQIYKKRRRQGPDEFSKGGASLGILEMYRKSEGSVDFKVLDSDEGIKLLCYEVLLK